MRKEHPLGEIVRLQKGGVPKGICSVCSANEYVIEAVMERAKIKNTYVLIEATANQVNQFGGYTGMTPDIFRDHVLSIARRTGFPEDMVILGGDHLGPLVWKGEKSAQAMEKARELIKSYVLAGFTKIHIDTSMRLADDLPGMPLETETIAERGAVLCSAAEEAYNELKKSNPNTAPLVYVVGSEVPVPGGSQEHEDGVKVTGASDFIETVEVYKSVFKKRKLEEVWQKVVAVVVQPGVEFGDDFVIEYNRDKAKDLCNALKQYPGLVFEGHSTDYQTPSSLKQMVEDGIAILKVGPALTFALREGLFMLSFMEKELLGTKPGVRLSNFIDVLDQVMVENPDNWKKYYHGDESRQRFARKYSLSDRCRYYLPVQEVRDSISLLMKNLRDVRIPLALISQFMPVQYGKIRYGLLENDPEALVKDKVANVIDDYYHAVL